MITPEPTPPGRPFSLWISTRTTAGPTVSATAVTAREYASRISVSEAGGATASPMSPTSDDETKSSIGSRGFCGTRSYVGAHRPKWKMRSCFIQIASNSFRVLQARRVKFHSKWPCYGSPHDDRLSHAKAPPRQGQLYGRRSLARLNRFGGYWRHTFAGGFRDQRLIFLCRTSDQECRSEDRPLIAVARRRSGSSCCVYRGRIRQERPLRGTPLRQPQRQDCFLELHRLRGPAGGRTGQHSVREHERRAHARDLGSIQAVGPPTSVRIQTVRPRASGEQNLLFSTGFPLPRERTVLHHPFSQFPIRVTASRISSAEPA